MSWPSSRMRPLVGFSRPTISRPIVVLPHPDSPTSPNVGTVGQRERHVGDRGDLADPSLQNGAGGDGEVFHHLINPEELTLLESGGVSPGRGSADRASADNASADRPSVDDASAGNASAADVAGDAAAASPATTAAGPGSAPSMAPTGKKQRKKCVSPAAVRYGSDSMHFSRAYLHHGRELAPGWRGR